MAVVYRSDEEEAAPSGMRASHGFALVVLIVALLALFFGLYGFYYGHWYQGPARGISHALPLPAATVNGDIIWYDDVVELAVLFEATVGEGDAFSEALDTAVRRAHVEDLASELDVSVSKDEQRAFMAEVEDLEAFLDEISWSERQYLRYVVEPLLLQQIVEEAAYGSRDLQSVAFAEIDRILSSYNEIGIAFDDLAAQYSEDPSSVLDGDVGFYEQHELPEGYEDVWSMEIGEVSDVLETHDTFAIVFVYDELLEEEARTHVAFQVIVVNKSPLSEVLEEYAPEQNVRVFVR